MSNALSLKPRHLLKPFHQVYSRDAWFATSLSWIQSFLAPNNWCTTFNVLPLARVETLTGCWKKLACFANQPAYFCTPERLVFHADWCCLRRLLHKRWPRHRSDCQCLGTETSSLRLRHFHKRILQDEVWHWYVKKTDLLAAGVAPTHSSLFPLNFCPSLGIFWISLFLQKGIGHLTEFTSPCKLHVNKEVTVFHDARYKGLFTYL